MFKYILSFITILLFISGCSIKSLKLREYHPLSNHCNCSHSSSINTNPKNNKQFLLKTKQSITLIHLDESLTYSNILLDLHKKIDNFIFKDKTKKK